MCVFVLCFPAKETKMKVQLKGLNFRTVLPYMGEMYRHLEVNRERLAPWFWWAGNSVTPNRARFSLFVVAYILSSDAKKLVHKFNPKKLYDEQFVIFVDDKVAGMCGLDNIDIKNNKSAELWYLTFGNTLFGTADESVKLLEKYSLNLDLNFLYANIQSDNKKSINFIERNGYVLSDVLENVWVPARKSNPVNVCTYTKILSK